MRNHIHFNAHLVLGKTHVDEDVSNEDQHDAQHGEGQSLSVVMEVLTYVDVIQSNESIEVLLLDGDMSQLSHLHHQLSLLLVSESIVHQLVFNVDLSLFPVSSCVCLKLLFDVLLLSCFVILI